MGFRAEEKKINSWAGQRLTESDAEVGFDGVVKVELEKPMIHMEATR